MRLVLVTGIFAPDIGGPATHAHDVAEGLRDLGHSVVVLTLTDEPCVRRGPGLLRVPRRWPWPLRLLWLSTWLVRHRRSYDAVYSTGLYLECGVGTWAARRPLIMKVAGDPAWERSRREGLTDLDFDEFQVSPPRALRVWAMRLSRTLPARLASRVTAPSSDLAAVVDGWIGRPGATRVVSNGVAVSDDLEDRGNRGWEGRTIYVGRLVDHKRVDLLIKAIASSPDVSMTIVGDGPAEASLRSLVAELKVEARVTFAGRCSHEDAMRLISASDLLLNASAWEGLPHVALEALVLGVPVAATPAGGTSDVIEDGQNGLLISPGTSAGFAEAFKHLADDAKVFERLVGHARETGSKHRIEETVQEIAEMCAQLISHGRSDERTPTDATKPFVVFVGGMTLDGSEDATKLQTIARHLDAVIVGRGRFGSSRSQGVTLMRLPAQIPALRVLGSYGLAPLIGLVLAAVRRGAIVFQGPHQAFVAIAVSRIIPSAIRPALVVEVHGDWRTATRLYGSRARRIFSPIADQAAEIALTGADRIRVIGDYTARLVMNVGYAGPVDRYIAYSAYEDFLEAPLKPSPGSPTVLFAGMLQPNKAPDVLLRAWAVVRQRRFDASLILAGDGPMKDSLEHSALRLGVRDSVQFAGQVTRHDLAELMDASSFMVLPSRSEGLGRVILESFARSRPVVASRVGGIPDVIDDGVTGLLVDPDDVDALAAAMCSLLSDPEYCAEMGARARAWVVGLNLAEEFETGIVRLAASVRSSGS